MRVVIVFPPPLDGPPHSATMLRGIVAPSLRSER
jgi:hypothetical protein